MDRAIVEECEVHVVTFLARGDNDGYTRLAKRLGQLRNAKGLSQTVVAKRSGLAQTYVSRIERGHLTPTLPLLERLAKCLKVELYQIFLVRGVKSESPVFPLNVPSGSQERSLLQTFREMTREDRSLLMYMARQMASRAANAGEESKANHD